MSLNNTSPTTREQYSPEDRTIVEHFRESPRPDCSFLFGSSSVIGLRLPRHNIAIDSVPVIFCIPFDSCPAHPSSAEALGPMLFFIGRVSSLKLSASIPLHRDRRAQLFLLSSPLKVRTTPTGGPAGRSGEVEGQTAPRKKEKWRNRKCNLT